MTPEQRLQQMGLSLPPPAAPVGAYVPYALMGDIAITSGQLPTRDGQVITGKVGPGMLTIEQGAEAARFAALNALSRLVTAAKDIDGIVRIVRLGVYVNSAAGFTDQPKVANGASEFFVTLFGDAGRHARTAIGVSELPLDAVVEVEVMAQIRV